MSVAHTWVGSGDLGAPQQTVPAALSPPERSQYAAARLSQRVGLSNESVSQSFLPWDVVAGLFRFHDSLTTATLSSNVRRSFSTICL